MDNCFVDVTVEFLAVAFHSILYYASVYPKSIFESRRKYNIVVYRSIHPEVNQYIDLCLKSISETLKCKQLKRLEFSITDSEYKPLVKFVFDYDYFNSFDETADAYLIQTEQNIRTLCLQLSNISHKLNKLPEDRSFSIFIHTNESTAVCMASNPDLEDFPLIQVEEKFEESYKILPLKRFAVRNCNIDTYIEIIGDIA